MATERLDIAAEIASIAADAESYFSQAKAECGPHAKVDPLGWGTDYGVTDLWELLSSPTKDMSNGITDRLLHIAAPVAHIAKTAPLTGSEDVQDVKEAAKAMRAALRLRRYQYQEPQVIHDEDRVLGFRPAEQYERVGLEPVEAEKVFRDGLVKLRAVLKLVESGREFEAATLPSGTTVAPTKYRAGTAFIMMWMDQKLPELTDVADTVKSVFGSFGIQAVRADDIEHEGLITDRILSEIQTSEFLFADLTGARPNVYYEVGFAHALGKRVILFRKSGTGLHFDLAGYNCPDYDNLRDLREKLTKRLVGLTNRNPSNESEI
ncbi:MAG TPA: hypothetical protein VF811_11735 [Parasulfuritortus sp.]